jgi:hypothetical protein
LNSELMCAACGMLSLDALLQLLHRFKDEVWAQQCSQDSRAWASTELILSQPTDVATLEQLQAKTPLVRALVVQGPQPISVRWWRTLGRFTQLQRVAFHRLFVWPQASTIQRAMRRGGQGGETAFLGELRELDMTGCRNLTDAWLAACLFLPSGKPRFSRLDRLILADCTALTAHVWPLVHALGPSLQQLVLDRASALIFEPFLDAATSGGLVRLCREMSTLSHLSFRGCACFTDKILRLWCNDDYAAFPGLRSLDVDGCAQLTPDALRFIACHPRWGAHLAHVSCLEARHMTFSGIDWFASNLHRRTLREFHLSGSTPEHDVGRLLRRVQGDSRLATGDDEVDRANHEAFLEKNLGDTAVEQFVGIVGPALRHLTLRNCLFHRAFERERALGQCLQLEQLDLSHHLGITSEMTRLVATLPRLTDLCLAGCRNADVVSLTQLARAPALVSLDLSDCGALDDATLSSILRRQVAVTTTTTTMARRSLTNMTVGDRWRRIRADRCPLLTGAGVAHLLDSLACVGTTLQLLRVAECARAGDAHLLAAVLRARKPPLTHIAISCAQLDEISVCTLADQVSATATTPPPSSVWEHVELDNVQLESKRGNDALWHLCGQSEQLRVLRLAFVHQTIVQRASLLRALSFMAPNLEQFELVASSPSSGSSNSADSRHKRLAAAVNHWSDAHLEQLLLALPYIHTLRLFQPNRFTSQALLHLATLAPSLHALALAPTPIAQQYFHSDTFRDIPTTDRPTQLALLQRLSWFDWNQEQTSNRVHLDHILSALTV